MKNTGTGSEGSHDPQTPFMQPETVQPNSAQDAVPEAEVKVFRFSYSKTSSICSSISVQAASQEEAEKFLATQEGEGDFEYKLDTNVDSEEHNLSLWDRDALVDVENLEDRCSDYDYEDDVLPALNAEV